MDRARVHPGVVLAAVLARGARVGQMAQVGRIGMAGQVRSWVVTSSQRAGTLVRPTAVIMYAERTDRGNRVSAGQEKPREPHGKRR
jgi:hypothetical protein